MLVQEIRDLTRGKDNYQLDSDVRGDSAFLLRGVKTYFQQKGLIVCDDLNKMSFEGNPQYPNGFMPKAKTNKLSHKTHIQSAFLSFGLVINGTELDGVCDGACGRYA